MRRAWGAGTHSHRKRRAILHSIFSYGRRMRWCDANPVDNIEVPRVQEQEIVPLTLQEVEKLEQTAEQPQHRAMRTSLHLMLYCGLLPNEVARLRPDDIQLQEKWVLIHPPATGKTAGWRCAAPTDSPAGCRISAATLSPASMQRILKTFHCFN